MPLRALVLSFLCAASAAQDPYTETLKADADLSAKARAEMEALRPLVEELRQLRESYGQALDLETAAKKRESVLTRLGPRLAELHARQKVLLDITRGRIYLAGAHVVRGALKGEGADKNPTLAPYADLTSAEARVSRFLHETDELLGYEGAEFSALQDRIESEERSRRIRWLGFGALGLLALGFGARLLARRPGMEGPAPEPVKAPLPQPAPRPELAPPSRFRVIAELEPWLFGRVFDAEDLTTRRRVVLKQLREDEKRMDAVLSSVRRLLPLRHPNIEELLAVFIEADRIHVAVEPFEGKRLSDIIQEGAFKDYEAADRVFSQILLAAEHSHGKAVVHGDLDSAKVRISSQGLVRLCDLGIAPPAANAYRAPEAELGTVVQESDIFSLGVILYEMLAGEVPFPGPDLLQQKRAKAYKRLSPPGIDAVLDRMLDPVPHRRFPTATDVIEALAEISG